MNEQDVRALVRDVIAKHAAGGVGPSTPLAAGGAPPVRTMPVDARRLPRVESAGHASHGMFVLPAGVDTDGPCLIEPAVACNHCGYCKSYGH